LQLAAQHNLSRLDVEIHPHEVLGSDGNPLFSAIEEKPQEKKVVATPLSPRLAPTLRFAESSAATRQRRAHDDPSLIAQLHHGHGHGVQGECLPRTDFGLMEAPPPPPAALDGQLPPQNHHGGSSNKVESTTEAWVTLRAGVGAQAWQLSKSPRVRSAIADVVFDMASQARAHLDHARSLSSSLPQSSKAALLHAQPLQAFLTRLEQQRFDVFSSGGLGPWVDGRPHARVLLQGSLIYHTMRDSF